MSDTVFLLRMGYTCLCGEKVKLFRIRMNRATPNRTYTRIVTCKNGHIRTVTVDQLASLDHWVEEIEEQALATGT